jgi:hypothetical protein
VLNLLIDAEGLSWPRAPQENKDTQSHSTLTCVKDVTSLFYNCNLVCFSVRPKPPAAIPASREAARRDGNRVGRTRIYDSRIHTHEIKLNSYLYPFTLVGTDLYLYPYPTDIRYPPAH